MFFKKQSPKTANQSGKDGLSKDLQAIIDEAFDDRITQKETTKKILMEKLTIFIVDRDHKIATTFYKRGQDEPKA